MILNIVLNAKGRPIKVVDELLEKSSDLCGFDDNDDTREKLAQGIYLWMREFHSSYFPEDSYIKVEIKIGVNTP